MKRLTSILALITGFVLLTTFSCCSDEDKPLNQLFIGSWKLVKHGYTNGKLATVKDGEIMTLQDNSFVFYDWMIRAYVMGTFRYEIKNNYFYMHVDNPEVSYWYKYKYKITQKDLQLTLIETTASAPPEFAVFLYKRTNNRYGD